MKKLCGVIAGVFALFSLVAQTINRSEYYIDTDPGAGNGSAITVPTGATSSFTATIAIGSIAPGFHLLAIRGQQSDGRWGLPEIRGFYVSEAVQNATNITAAEYFWDTDPGAGNATGIPVNNGVSSSFNVLLPTTGLQPGFHFLAIRTKNTDGQWGLFESRGYYISENVTDAANITSAEYFVDTDPGSGNGIAMSVSSGSTVVFTASVPTASLPAGFHLLAIRTKDAGGKWGPFESRGFYISPATVNMRSIVAAEYFLDADPGIGNGSPLIFSTPGQTVTQTFSLPVPPGTVAGQHTIVMRVKDSAGIWSLFDTARITTPPLPLTWLSFTGRRMGQKTALQWQTANEVNTSHFMMERSKNGIDFTSVGSLPAAGTGNNTYAYDDLAPLKGLNFYRLQQVDKDGKFKYSPIVKLYFGDDALNTLKLYPVPTKSNLSIVFSGTGNSLFVQVYDAAGKLVMNERRNPDAIVNLSIHHLSKGMYWIVVSDGITMQKGKFEKE